MQATSHSLSVGKTAGAMLLTLTPMDGCASSVAIMFVSEMRAALLEL